MKKLLTMALGLALCFTLSIPAFSTWSHTLSEREPASEGMTSDEVLIQGQPGDVFYVGDLVLEIVSADEFDQAVSVLCLWPVRDAGISTCLALLSAETLRLRTTILGPKYGSTTRAAPTPYFPLQEALPPELKSLGPPLKLLLTLQPTYTPPSPG